MPSWAGGVNMYRRMKLALLNRFWYRREKLDLLNRLAMLGSTGNEVAKTLEGLDITGLAKGSGSVEERCPLAYYLRRQYNTASVSVGHSRIRVGPVCVATPGI